MTINQTEFNYLAHELFQAALDDINGIRAGKRPLLDSTEVSFQSFLRYLRENQLSMMLGISLPEMAMLLYKKAVDDIAFQTGEHRFYLHDIPISRQLSSCKTCVDAFTDMANDAERSDKVATHQ